MGVGSVKMIKTKWLWTLRNGKNKLNFFVKKSCYLTIFIIVYLGGEKDELFLGFFFFFYVDTIGHVILAKLLMGLINL
jgi:hypothetical protein